MPEEKQYKKRVSTHIQGEVLKKFEAEVKSLGEKEAVVIRNILREHYQPKSGRNSY